MYLYTKLPHATDTEDSSQGFNNLRDYRKVVRIVIVSNSIHKGIYHLFKVPDQRDGLLFLGLETVRELQQQSVQSSDVPIRFSVSDIG